MRGVNTSEPTDTLTTETPAVHRKTRTLDVISTPSAVSSAPLTAAHEADEENVSRRFLAGKKGSIVAYCVQL